VSKLVLRPMRMGDMDAVLRIEQRIHPHPWTRGNFADTLGSSYLCKVAELNGEMVGYALMMPAVDEVQLLNIGIVTEHQGKGLGGELLERMAGLARALKMQRMLLEVRPSNAVALALYRKHGFRQIGLRHGYYPAGAGREDAIVMERIL
jgi:ribosomal-protein-alanine N-acetyltransferase